MFRFILDFFTSRVTGDIVFLGQVFRGKNYYTFEGLCFYCEWY